MSVFAPLLVDPTLSPVRTVDPINEDWLTHLQGLVLQMREPSYWAGSQSDIDQAIDNADTLIYLLMGKSEGISDDSLESIWDESGDFIFA